MRDRILETLRNAKGEISGQLLSEQLKISRAAVSKHIKTLRGQGYQIESTPHVGYRFIAAPNKPYPTEIKQYLADDDPWSIEWQERLDSTNNVLRQAAIKGAPHFSALLAGTQTAGRGRLGRSWYTKDNKGIWMSVLLRPSLHPTQAHLFTLASAVAIAEALRDLGYPVAIKWPNDLLLDGKKVCGILAEMQADPDQVQWLIVGLGINCYPYQMPEELENIAVSLNAHQPLAQIAAAVLQKIEEYYNILCRQGFDPIRLRWRQYCSCLDKAIIARTMQGELHGIARDIDEQGYLLLEFADGTVKPIVAGDIHLE